MKTKRRFTGQSLVEFAIIFPILLFLLTGFLDLGRAVFYYSSLTHAVREATRYAIVNKSEIAAAINSPGDNSLQDKVLENAFGLTTTAQPLTKADITVTPSGYNHQKNAYTVISIDATYTFKPVTPGITLIFGGQEGINLTAQSTMRISGGSR
jgi:Flp pilus assembly protein TadG